MIIIFYNKILLPTKLWGTGFAKCTKVAFPAPGERAVSAGDGTCHVGTGRPRGQSVPLEVRAGRGQNNRDESQTCVILAQGKQDCWVRTGTMSQGRMSQAHAF